MLGPNERTAMRGWLVFLSLFEVSPLYNYLIKDARMEGFFSTLKNARPEKRVWSMVLALLVLCRLLAAWNPDEPGVMLHCAAVHVLEAVVFGNEWLVHKSQGGAPVFVIIVLNAVWFSSAALRL